MSLGAKDDEHLIAFHSRPRFNFSDVRQVLFQLFENACAEFPVRHFAPAEPNRRFYLIALLQPLARMLHSITVIVIVRPGTKLHFFYSYGDLLLLRFVPLLLRFVLELTEVDNPANRRIGVWGYFDEIQTAIPSGTNSVAHVHDAKLFTFLANHAYLRHADSLVDAYWRQSPVVGPWTAASKACSYCCTS